MLESVLYSAYKFESLQGQAWYWFLLLFLLLLLEYQWIFNAENLKRLFLSGKRLRLQYPTGVISQSIAWDLSKQFLCRCKIPKIANILYYRIEFIKLQSPAFNSSNSLFNSVLFSPFRFSFFVAHIIINNPRSKVHNASLFRKKWRN